MASYPDYRQDLGTKVTQVPGLHQTIMGNGKVRGRYDRSTPSFTIVAVHDNQSKTNYDALLTFLAAHRGGPAFDFLAHEDSTTYHNVFFVDKDPVVAEPLAGRKFKITSRMVVSA